MEKKDSLSSGMEKQLQDSTTDTYVHNPLYEEPSDHKLNVTMNSTGIVPTVCSMSGDYDESAFEKGPGAAPQGGECTPRPAALVERSMPEGTPAQTTASPVDIGRIDPMHRDGQDSVSLRSRNMPRPGDNAGAAKNSPPSTIATQLNELNQKLKAFFPLKTATRPSVEEIQRPDQRKLFLPSKRSTTKKSVTFGGSSVINDQKIDSKTPFVKSTKTPKQVDDKNQVAVSENKPKKIAPWIQKNILAAKMGRVKRCAPTGKPKPFLAGGANKGIPALADLPKPTIGILPLQLTVIKIQPEKITSLSKTEGSFSKKKSKPAIKSEEPMTSTSSSSLRTHSTSDLIANRSQKPEGSSLRTQSTSDLVANGSQKPKGSSLRAQSKSNVIANRRQKPKGSPLRAQSTNDIIANGNKKPKGSPLRTQSTNDIVANGSKKTKGSEPSMTLDLEEVKRLNPCRSDMYTIYETKEGLTPK